MNFGKYTILGMINVNMARNSHIDCPRINYSSKVPNA